MFDSMRIRTKLAIALVIPLLALVVLSTVAISSANRRAADAREKDREVAEEIDLALATVGPSSVLKAIDDERMTTSIDLIGYRELMKSADPIEARRVANDAVEAFRSTIASKPSSVQAKFAGALAAIDKLPAIRAQVDGFGGPRSYEVATQDFARGIFDAYSNVIVEIAAVNTQATQTIDDPTLRTGARFIDDMANWSVGLTRTIRMVSTASRAEGGAGANLGAFSASAKAYGRMQDLEAEMRSTGVPLYTDLANRFLADASIQGSIAVIEKALQGGTLDVNDLLTSQTLKGTELLQQTVADAATHLSAEAAAIRADSQQEATVAENQARSLLLGTGIVLVLAIGVTLVASRSISKPMHRLTIDAERMANTELPSTVQGILDAPLGDDVVVPELGQIDTSGGYEIAEVATALNTVQHSAAELAVEQAVLRRNIADSFVNLGRRNQNLLSRQLASITEMEQAESDPDELAKLFTLDHLATRMRRNAESLLLLAGLEPHRKWSSPVAIGDILRGALGEVEEYDRVSIRTLDAASIKGAAAADITHLIAELLENALEYSPPGRDVEIVGRRNGDNYALAIIDFGVGMSEDDLAQANTRLAGQESFTVAPSKYLGHYVVGRQSARLGVPVALADTTEGGITATIDLGAILGDDEVMTNDDHAPEDELADGGPGEAGPVAEDVDGGASEWDEAWIAATDPTTEQSIGAGDPPEPASLAEALGQPMTTPRETTASGYTKRVRGASQPNTQVASLRSSSSDGPRPKRSAEHRRNALSGLQAGQALGRVAAAKYDDETEEDAR